MFANIEAEYQRQKRLEVEGGRALVRSLRWLVYGMLVFMVFCMIVGALA